MRNLIYIFLLPVILFISCGGPKLDDNTVAIVANETISAGDLVLSLELMPGWAPSRQGQAAIEAHLQLLIEKKLFAREGYRLGYHQDAKVKQVVNWFKNEELRKALYRTEIEEKIEITEQDLLSAYQKGNIQHQVRHLFARTESELQTIQQALNQGVPWEEIAQYTFSDSLLAHNGGDLGWIGYGAMEPTFEDTVFSLPIGKISQPVRTRYGWHLIQVLNTRKNIFTTEDDFQAQKPRLLNELTRREEQKRSSEFINNFMAAKDVKMINKTFDLLVEKIRDHVFDNRTPGEFTLPQIKDGELDNLSSGLEPYLTEILVTYNGDHWTIGDLLEKMTNLPITKRPRLKSPVQFRNDLGLMIRDDLLAQEAKRRGLEHDPVVQKEVQHWQDEYTFSRLWQDILDTISVSDQQALEFYTQHRSRYWWPDQVQIQEILLKSQDEARRVVARLQQGADFADMAKKYSLRTGTADNGGDLGWISRGQMGNISQVAFHLEKGAISAPIQVEGGYSVIKVLAKRNQRELSFAEAKNRVLADVRNQLRGQVYRHRVDKLKSDAKIQINDSLLTSLGKNIEKGRVVMPGIRGIYPR